MLPYEKCSGCGACKAVCPKRAITFQPNDEGFPYPIIDNTICIHCGLCEKTCPILNPPDRNAILVAYAAQCLDKEALKESTSGGVFTMFAREVFQRGGVVYGCVWDERYNAVIRRAENEEEMKPMRGSKYVWSWAGDTFREIKTFLENGRVVLFSGLPCQVAGLKSFLKQEYENLYVIDFLCSGAPSPLALHSYLETLCSLEDLKNLNLKFRDKNPYGVGVHITYAGKKSKPKSEHITNSYYYSFYKKIIDRNSCYKCLYGTEQRVSDFTVGDYWGIEKYHHELDIKSGVSVLLVNSKKGELFIKNLDSQLKMIETNLHNVAKSNSLSLDATVRISRRPAIREEFFKTLKLKGWKVAERRFLYSKNRFALLLKQKTPKILLNCLPGNLVLMLKKVFD